LSAESEVKLTVCIGVPPEMAGIGHLVEITISREVAMTGIGKGGPVSGNGQRKQKSVTPTTRQSGFATAAASQRMYPELVPVGFALFRARRHAQSRNRSLFIETEICDFRRDRARVACSAPPRKPRLPNSTMCIRF
jgi:hypothetical protein